MTAVNEPKPANVEVAIDQKAQRAAVKLLLTQKEKEIYNNYATPLVGTFLNLTAEPAVIECPACGVQELSDVHLEPKTWVVHVRKMLGCMFLSLCCCCCFDYKEPFGTHFDTNHYCKNCYCYYGRANRVPPKRV